MSTSTIVLPDKPGARLSYTYMPAKTLTKPTDLPLIVFLNGLGLPASSWNGTIDKLTQQQSHPSLLSYDRYGQGESEKDPTDQNAPEPAFAHDCLSAIQDLHNLIGELFVQNPTTTTKKQDLHRPKLFLVANSIGCALARLYISKYPRQVSHLLFLDSIIASSRDFIGMWPDPDQEGFDESVLPEGVTAVDLRETRAKYRVIFDPQHGTMGNAEGLSRRNLADLLPFADEPALDVVDDVWLTVVGHDFDRFALDSLKTMATPLAITKTYTNPTWQEYNDGLARLVSKETSKGPIQAKGCGHFIQRDDCDFVVGEIRALGVRSGMWD